MSAVEASAAVVRRRFAGLRPSDLLNGVQLVGCRGVDADGDDNSQEAILAARPPSAALRPIWCSVSKTGFEQLPMLSDAALERSAFMVVVCDIFDDAQREVAHNLLLWLDTNEVAPPVAFLPVRTLDPATGAHAGKLLRGLLDAWVHDFILGEPSGSELALAIRASFAKVQAKSERVMDEYRVRAMHVDRVRTLKEEVNVTLWQYVPTRFGLTLPPVSPHLGDADGLHFAGYTMRRRLGRGAFGQVFEIEPPAGTRSQPGGEVVKAISKTVLRSARDLRQLQRIWQIMQLLSGRWRHPNIARSYQIYNSPTHIYIRMENAGNENLFQRLRARDAGTRPLGLAQLHSLVRQIASAIEHLHTGPQVCHRDVKPENVLLATTSDGQVVAKLVDFDTAMVQTERVPCRATCGTFPFMAPEVAEKEYDGMAADMWSVGLVFLELVCFTRIVERRLMEMFPDEAPLVEEKAKGCPHKAVNCLKAAFTDNSLVRRMLRESHVHELEPVVDWYEDAIGNLCKIGASTRWTSTDLLGKLPEVVVPEPVGTEQSLGDGGEEASAADCRGPSEGRARDEVPWEGSSGSASSGSHSDERAAGSANSAGAAAGDAHSRSAQHGGDGDIAGHDGMSGVELSGGEQAT
mmetsp:Transcript_76857/g.222100  ORF Transcript_76857/g.222100 Transcript_76857/m.222100 type:complete len:633 (-) Transcript_76857:36-1934(-)